MKIRKMLFEVFKDIMEFSQLPTEMKIETTKHFLFLFKKFIISMETVENYHVI